MVHPGDYANIQHFYKKNGSIEIGGGTGIGGSKSKSKLSPDRLMQSAASSETDEYSASPMRPANMSRRQSDQPLAQKHSNASDSNL